MPGDKKTEQTVTDTATSRPVPKMNTESYTPVGENLFINASNDPLSTFRRSMS